MFDIDFAENVSSEIKNNKDLEEQVKFFIIGSERNNMVHSNFL